LGKKYFQFDRRAITISTQKNKITASLFKLPLFTLFAVKFVHKRICFASPLCFFVCPRYDQIQVMEFESHAKKMLHPKGLELIMHQKFFSLCSLINFSPRETYFHESGALLFL